MRTRLKRWVSFALTVCMVISLFAMNIAWASNSWTTTEKINTSDIYAGQLGEYYEARTPLDEDNALYVEGIAPTGTKMLLIRVVDTMSKASYISTFVRPTADGKFSVAIDTTEGNTNTPAATCGTVLSANDRAWSSQPGYKAMPNMPQGLYFLQITAAKTDRDAEVCDGAEWYAKDRTLGGNHGYVWKNAILSVSGDNNNPKLVKFTEIINKSKQVQSADKLSDPVVYARYTDVQLRDLDYVLTDANYQKKPMNADRVAYIKNVAEKITAGAATDTEKLGMIYAYVASNYYYDFYAHNLYLKTGTNLQCANPYDNLYNLRNKIASTNSTADGKVAICCDGYSALVVALCRSLGIPARVVIGSTNNTKDGVSSTVDTTKKNHWWAEVYINGRWVTVDAERGSLNSWNRDELSLKEKDPRFKDAEYKSDAHWDYQGWTVSGLDMSYESRAATFQMIGVQDSTNGKPFVKEASIASDAATGKPKITWTPLDGSSKYYIYRGTKESNIAYYKSVKSGSSFVDADAQAGKTYYYWVRPVDGAGGEGARSNMVSCVCRPGKPDLKVSCKASSGKPVLTWKAVSGAAKYYIYRSVDGGKTYTYFTSTTKTEYTNTGAVAGNTYYYKVKAVTAAGTTGNYSVAKCVVCDCARPELSITTSSGKPKLTWKAVSGATKYEIYRSTDGKTFSYYTSTTKNSYTNTGAKKGKTYYYKVKAVSSKNSYATSAYSVVKKITATK